MEILAARTLRASTLVFQQGTENPTLAVVAKATFHLTPGMVRLAEPELQEAITEEDNHWDDDPARSLRFASDLVPCKGRVDVLLDASAQAPADGRSSVTMRLIVGGRDRPLVDKSLVVSPPQFVLPNGTIQREPWPHLLSIRYERAAGGPGTANPAGVSPHGPRDAKGRLALPSIEALSGKSASEPIGFGPIASTWPTRLSKVARIEHGFSLQDWQRRPIPTEFRWSYFNVAPGDQQIDGILRLDERIVLENVVPHKPVFETRLVAYRPEGYVCRANGAREKLQWVCDTMALDAIRLRLFTVWRAHVVLSSAKESGQVAIALAEPSQKLGFAEVARLSGLTREDDSGSTQILPRAGKRKGTLKILDAAGSKAAPPASDETQPLRSDLIAKPAWAQRKGTQELPLYEPSSPLPFLKSAPASPPPIAPPPPVAPPMVTNISAMPPVTESPWAKGVASALSLAPPAAAPEVRSSEPGSLGVLSASNAAAETEEKGLVKAPAVDVIAKNEGRAKEKPREIVELLWYDPAALPRIRRHLAWKKIIAELKPRPSDDDFDGGLPPEQMKAAKDKRDVLGVLARGEVMDLEGIRRVMDMAVLEDGSFVPPYVLTQGTLEFQFDEVETLKAMLLVVAPFVPGDKKLKETVDLVNEVLKTPGIERAKRVAEGLTKRLKDAFYQQNRGVGPEYLDEEVEWILLQGRHYHTVDMKGSEWCRAWLSLRGETSNVLVHVKNESIQFFPEVMSLGIRLIARVNRCQKGRHDVTNGLVLDVIALATSNP